MYYEFKHGKEVFMLNVNQISTLYKTSCVVVMNSGERIQLSKNEIEKLNRLIHKTDDNCYFYYEKCE